LILLGLIGIALGALFWKHFSKSTGELIKAFIATVIGTIAIILFLFQVAIMTMDEGQNLITFISTWLTNQ
jgi:uncharacterized membrane protein YeaQ/YmgE (transglycosylase-associated protein family)